MDKFKFGKKLGVIFAILVSIISFSLLIFIEYNVYVQYTNDELVKTTKRFSHFQETLKNTIHNNIDFIDTFSSYLSSARSIDEKLANDEASDFLFLILENKSLFIKNTYLLKDTSFYWSYSGNESNNVNSDFFRKRKEIIENTKETFSGIFATSNESNKIEIFVPFKNDGIYWGQLLVELDKIGLIQLVESLENQYNLEVTISSAFLDIPTYTFYNEDFVESDRDLFYNLNSTIAKLIVRAKPSLDWHNSTLWTTFVPFFILLFSIFLGSLFYNYYINSSMVTHQAHHDTLTGLFNRNYLHKYTSRVFNVAELNNIKLGIIVLDINNFKEINDTFGHGIGDLVLINYSERLKKSLRDKQEVFRIGGDEFLIIIEDIPSSEILYQIANRIKDSIANTMKVSEHKLSITASIGCSIYPDDGKSLEETMHVADEEMYKNKFS